jgi:hypothetical protein
LTFFRHTCRFQKQLEIGCELYSNGALSGKTHAEYQFDDLGNWIMKQTYLLLPGREDHPSPESDEVREISYFSR